MIAWHSNDIRLRNFSEFRTDKHQQQKFRAFLSYRTYINGLIYVPFPTIFVFSLQFLRPDNRKEILLLSRKNSFLEKGEPFGSS